MQMHGSINWFCGYGWVHCLARMTKQDGIGIWKLSQLKFFHHFLSISFLHTSISELFLRILNVLPICAHFQVNFVSALVLLLGGGQGVCVTRDFLRPSVTGFPRNSNDSCRYGHFLWMSPSPTFL